MVMRMRGNSFGSEINDLRKDVNRLKDDLRHLAEGLVGIAKHQTESLQSTAKSSMRSVRDYFEENPMMAFVVVLGAGLLAGAVLSGRRNEIIE